LFDGYRRKMADEAAEPAQIRHIAWAFDDSTLFATGEWERIVEVWSIPERRRVSRFETVLDPGGRRLAFVGAERPVVVAAAWARYGIRGYDAVTGECLWQRRDLKKAQILTTVSGRRVAAGIEGRPLHVLSCDTGETLLMLRGVSSLHGRRGAAQAVAIVGSGIALFDVESGRRLWRADGPMYGSLLHAALGPDGVAVSQMGGPVCCYDMAGTEQWRWSPPGGEHVLRLGWSPSGNLLGVLRPYETRVSPGALLAFGPDGGLTSAAELVRPRAFEFDRGGELLALSTELVEGGPPAGSLRRVPDGSALWQFR
jgi:hypothetical protein